MKYLILIGIGFGLGVYFADYRVVREAFAGISSAIASAERMAR